MNGKEYRIISEPKAEKMMDVTYNDRVIQVWDNTPVIVLRDGKYLGTFARDIQPSDKIEHVQGHS